MAKMWAWATIYNGGKAVEGRDGRKLISERNVTEPGKEVTAAKLGVSKEEFDHLIDNGSVRSYPLPKNLRDGESPASAVMRSIVNRDGEVSQDVLMELALSHPPEGAVNPPADEEAELPAGV